MIKGEMMTNKYSVSEIFKRDANDIVASRAECVNLHSNNIRAAGNQVEICVREYLSRMIPDRYCVTHGHLIDNASNTSTQLDLIISDNSNLPSLFTASDGTQFIPIDSTYVIGEIKSTYKKSEKYIQKFSSTIEKIRTGLNHEEVINTAYEGITPSTTIEDTLLAKRNRILNSIFSFIIFVDAGDFKFADICPFLSATDSKYLPNLIVLLNKGVILKGIYNDGSLWFSFDPENPVENKEWILIPISETKDGSIEGNHLAFLYDALLAHLTNSYLGPPLIGQYLKDMFLVDLSKVELLSKSTHQKRI